MFKSANGLHSGPYVDELRRDRDIKIIKEVSELKEDSLLISNLDDLTDRMIEKYTFHAPILDFDAIKRTHTEGKVTEYGRVVRNVTLHIPFEGDPNLFYAHPSSTSIDPHPTEVNIRGGELLLTFQLEADTQAMNRRFQGSLEIIKRNTTTLAKEVEGINSNLHAFIRPKLRNRKDEILRARDLLESLDFPLRERPGAAQTYSAPIQRKEIPIAQTPAASAFKPEPELRMEQYEHILKVIGNAARIMEYNPETFLKLREEDLRNILLVLLNTHYEGRATGETFNGEGKVDILIREGDRNLFIAECKKWKGPATVSESLDQILGYLTWRDTKAALVLFCYNKDFSKTVGQVPDLVKAHSNFKRQLTYKGETGSRYLLTNKVDHDREIYLSVLLFHIPDSDPLT